MTGNDLRFYLHCLNRDISNFSYLRHRNFDGFIISMHQSGTHWLKYMLSLAITYDKGLPPPDHIAHSIVIGDPKKPAEVQVKPSIALSHAILMPLFHMALRRTNNASPRYLVLVRKWADVYQCTFAEYLQGDPLNNRFDKDLWWDIRFLNRWGDIIGRYPEQVKIIRYEELSANTANVLTAAIDHLGIKLENKNTAIDFALAEATKNKMAARELKKDQLQIVRDENRSWSEWYTDDLKVVFSNMCRLYLKHSFFYDYENWES